MITLATLPQATAQEVFDQIVTHLRSQAVKSLSEDGNKCMYRGYNNTKCAGGCLISDDEYNPDMENQTWLSDIFPEQHSHLIVELQNVHDGYPVEGWEYFFQQIAENRELIYTPPKTLSTDCYE